MNTKDTRQRSYMALAPLSALAAIFINPLACTVIPLILFFIFRTSRPKVSLVALQTADLAFSVQLWIILTSLAVLMGISLDIFTPEDARDMMATATSIILILFTASLAFASYRAIQGKDCRHLFSFKIAERLLKITRKAAEQRDSKKDQ